MNNFDHILENEAEVLAFLKTRYPLYHLSNVFFRDIQYGIRTLLERKGAKVGYTSAERLAREFVERLEKQKILIPIDRQSWVLYYEDFKTAPPKRQAVAVTARPAPSAPSAKPAAARPAGGLPPLKSSAPASAARPAGGLPPLKSSAPAAGTRPVAAPGPQVPQKAETEARAGSSGPDAPEPEPKAAPVPKAEQPAAPKVTAPEQMQEAPTAPKKPSQGGTRPLPPIKSSVPVGNKK
jgi:hypothetical protein